MTVRERRARGPRRRDRPHRDPRVHRCAVHGRSANHRATAGRGAGADLRGRVGAHRRRSPAGRPGVGRRGLGDARRRRWSPRRRVHRTDPPERRRPPPVRLRRRPDRHRAELAPARCREGPEDGATRDQEGGRGPRRRLPVPRLRPTTGWCEAHHVKHWIDRGPTSLANLVLLCDRHHHVVHQPGWVLRFDGRDVTVFRPDGTELCERPRPMADRPELLGASR